MPQRLSVPLTKVLDQNLGNISQMIIELFQIFNSFKKIVLASQVKSEFGGHIVTFSIVLRNNLQNQGILSEVMKIKTKGLLTHIVIMLIKLSYRGAVIQKNAKCYS